MVNGRDPAKQVMVLVVLAIFALFALLLVGLVQFLGLVGIAVFLVLLVVLVLLGTVAGVSLELAFHSFAYVVGVTRSAVTLVGERLR